MCCAEDNFDAEYFHEEGGCNDQTPCRRLTNCTTKGSDITPLRNIWHGKVYIHYRGAGDIQKKKIHAHSYAVNKKWVRRRGQKTSVVNQKLKN